MPPEALYYMWMLFGFFGGYDNRNCNLVDRPEMGIIAIQCWGPPLPPLDAPIVEAEPKPAPRSSVRTRTARR